MPQRRQVSDAAPLWPFALYLVAGVAYVAVEFGAPGDLGLLKLVLMPALAASALIAARRITLPVVLLVVAIALSWLGDGAGTFFPFDDELPAMLACFGLAHVVYMVVFWRFGRPGPMPWWALVYAAWYVVTVAVLWPHLGALAPAVLVYGLVLGGTAALSLRCGPVVALGGALFLVSDTLLAFKIFAPVLMPDWAGDLVMITYIAGQGLIAAGLVLRWARPKAPAETTPTTERTA